MNKRLWGAAAAGTALLLMVPSTSGAQDLGQGIAKEVAVHAGGPVKQVSVYKRQGQHEECHLDVCSALALKPIRFVFPAVPSQGYDALVTVSMSYHTTRDDRFDAYLVVKRPTGGARLESSPEFRELSSGPNRSGTFQWLVRNLSEGDDYDLSVQPKVQEREGGYLVKFSHMMVTIQAVPRS